VVKNSCITVLGLTFKEDVPDLRNTRVVDIIDELDSYGLNVQVFDPMASHEEAMHEYGINLLKREQLSPADAVVLAVPHREFLDQGWGLIEALLEGGSGVVMDVKGRLARDQRPQGVTLWRL
jgi:UDP-N-acetyl-D-galactosamine dehydrogenase